MSEQNTYSPVGGNAKIPHSKKSIAITASILIAAVPGAAYALSTATHADNSSSVSVHASNTSPVNTATTEVPERLASDNDTASEPAGNQSSVSMTVNGQKIDMPANGSVSQTVPDGNGNPVNVNATTTSNGSANNSSSVSTSVSVNSNTSGTGGYSSSNINVFSSH